MRRLTARPNPDIPVSEEFKAALAQKELARRFIENKTAIVTVGLGLRPVARTVRGHVRQAITGTILERLAVSIKQRALIPIPVHHSEDLEVEL